MTLTIIAFSFYKHARLRAEASNVGLHAYIAPAGLDPLAMMEPILHWKTN